MMDSTTDCDILDRIERIVRARLAANGLLQTKTDDQHSETSDPWSRIRFSKSITPPSVADSGDAERMLATMTNALQTASKRPNLRDLVTKYTREKFNGCPKDFYDLIGIDRSMYSKVTSPIEYHPSKETVLKMAVGFRLTVDEANRFLAAAGYAFSDANKTDVIFKTCLEQGFYDLGQINELRKRFMCD